MELLFEPQTWVSFLTLAVLEIVLGIDNIVFLSLLVDRLPPPRRRSARIVGLGFAMLTRIALLFSVIWLANTREPLFAIAGVGISDRNLVLFAGGAFLVVKSLMEIRGLLSGEKPARTTGLMDNFWLIILQIGLIDIVFSLDTVFSAVGLANRVEVMIAAIVVSVLVMMMVSSAVSGIIERHPTIKGLALVFMVLVGVSLLAQSMDVEIPRSYLYFAMAVSAAVVWINMRFRR